MHRRHSGTALKSGKNGYQLMVVRGYKVLDEMYWVTAKKDPLVVAYRSRNYHPSDMCVEMSRVDVFSGTRGIGQPENVVSSD